MTDQRVETGPANEAQAQEPHQLHTEDLTARGGDAWPPPPSDDGEAGDGGLAALLGDTGEFATRWDTIQTGFVDEPRRAVEEADTLVAQVIQRLAESFSSERARLEQQWSRGDQVDTEELRVALRRYRTFFRQLLMQPDRR